MANPTFNPFVKKEAPAAPAAPAAETPAAAPKVKKAAGERKKVAPALTAEQIQQILALIKGGQKSYSEIAEEVGVTKYQVNRVLVSAKAKLKKAAAENPALAEKVEKALKALARPAESRPGARGPKGGKVDGAIQDIVGQLLAEI